VLHEVAVLVAVLEAVLLDGVLLDGVLLDGVALEGAGTWVVQTPSPWARVASRWTWVPSSRLKAAVSASQSAGNSAATWATGQWCWQICTPDPVTWVEAA
jgi:hypothetical protein